MNKREHIPVLLDEVLGYLSPRDGEIYVDCTFGTGGYSEGILRKADATVYAFDLDPEVASFVVKTKERLGKRGDSLHFIEGNFAELRSKLNGILVDGIVADLGVSSMQIDRKERGFSFQKQGPLDMRMSKAGLSAYDVINNYSAEDLADIIYKYGEETRSRHIARSIIQAREIFPITDTIQLADIIRGVFGKQRKKKIDFATKTFQAIRIFVNGEIDNLKKLLEASEQSLKEGGRLVVVSFHSVEDKVVKDFLHEKSSYEAAPSRYVPGHEIGKVLSFKALTKKPITPSESEIEHNVRSRSAKLRAAIRIGREAGYV
jgi:16S rRNA (cytosine1402-N4)-methyltransferase